MWTVCPFKVHGKSFVKWLIHVIGSSYPAGILIPIKRGEKALLSTSAQWFKTLWKLDKNVPLSLELRSEWVSERANEWALRSARVKRAVRSKRMSKQCKRTNEQMSEWSSTTVPIVRSSESLFGLVFRENNRASEGFRAYLQQLHCCSNLGLRQSFPTAQQRLTHYDLTIAC